MHEYISMMFLQNGKLHYTVRGFTTGFTTGGRLAAGTPLDSTLAPLYPATAPLAAPAARCLAAV